MARRVNKTSAKEMTKAEAEYVADLTRDPSLARVERGASEVLTPRDYPEPVKRFLARERLMVHIKLPARARRKLDELSRAKGMTPAQLARQWLESNLEREAS
jgi:hypothetical protein